jgi:hypothetical protein
MGDQHSLMTGRGWFGVTIAVATLGVGGCRFGGGDHVSGSGYGVGLARRAVTFGMPMSAHGSSQGVEAPTEREVGRIKAPPRVAYPPAGKILSST